MVKLCGVGCGETSLSLRKEALMPAATRMTPWESSHPGGHILYVPICKRPPGQANLGTEADQWLPGLGVESDY